MAEQSELAANGDALYYAVADASTADDKGARSKTFSQDELLSLGELKHTRDLMPLIQYLTDQGLFRTLKSQGRLAWSVRPREAAKQIRQLDRDEKLLYELIEEAHTEGIWSRDLRRKTNMAQNVVMKCLNKMEKNNLIKGVKSVKNPAQRTYMLYHLRPSEDVTGNSFFFAGDLDESFRDELMNLIVFWVRMQSWVDAGKRRPPKREREPQSPVFVPDDDNDESAATQQPASKKRKRATGDDLAHRTHDIEDSGARLKTRFGQREIETHFPQLMHRAGTHTYPTAESIHSFLTESGAFQKVKTDSLTVPEVQGCIDVLAWDGKLEKVYNTTDSSWGYRTIRGVTHRPQGAELDDFEDFPGTGLTQAPCGRCPVFDLCSEDGPVNPTECTYFEEWLKA